MTYRRTCSGTGGTTDEQSLQHESMPGGRMTEGEQVTISAYLLLARGQIGNNEGSTALRR